MERLQAFLETATVLKTLMGKDVKALIKIGLDPTIGASVLYVKKQVSMKGMPVTDVKEMAGYLSLSEDEPRNINGTGCFSV